MFKIRGGSSVAATSMIEHFVILINGWKPLTITTKRSILDVVAALDTPPNLNNRKKCTKNPQKGHKKFFHFTDTNVYKNSILLCHFYKNSILLCHFFVIWLSVKCEDFLIISNISQSFHVFILLCKGKLKVQQESATCLLCPYMLHVNVALFLRRSK